MASGVGGTGGGSRFPITPGNGGGKKRVRFRDPLVDPEPVRSAIDSINQTGEAVSSSATQAEGGKHVVTKSKDLGARPKTTQPSQSSTDWSSVVQQAASTARRWQQSRQETSSQDPSKEASIYSKDLKFDDSFGDKDYQDAESSSTTSPAEHSTLSDEGVSWEDYQDAESSKGSPQSSAFVTPPPPKPKKLIPPSQTNLPLSHSAKPSGQPSTPTQNILPPPPPPRPISSTTSSRGTTGATSSFEGARFSSSMSFDMARIEFLQIQLEFYAAMLRSLEIFANSTNSTRGWFENQITKYRQEQQQAKAELQQLKNESSSFSTVQTRSEGFRSATDQNIADSLNAGSQALEGTNRLSAAFEQLASSFEGRRLEFDTLDEGDEPYYQTPISQPHYQTPKDAYLSVLPDNNTRSEASGINAEGEDPVRRVEDESELPYYSIRSILRSVAECILNRLMWLIAGLRAAYSAAAEFIRRCCVRTTTTDTDDNEEAYQVLGQQDSADYETMERSFSRFMETAYGQTIENGMFRLPRARLRDDFAALAEAQEEILGILTSQSQSEESIPTNAPSERRETHRSTQRTSSRGTQTDGTNQVDRSTQTTHELTAFQLANRPLPPIGENVQDVVTQAKHVWQSLATASLPESVSPGRYNQLVSELRKVLSEIDDMVKQQ